ncbi:protein of unknown function [Magnetospirillum gryphiswaldense MSR-1 v2]|uniref:Uncharacterized protein n=1 Tax=Magnetospirillum gryphiswaldense (strain DSM 6361 / JCM 21280 / NBRC 15271 / MSR-1) TaxID=431944 RepID=V6F159_MAGGM|nr:hypothetical protein [Magnetospirillum gryphiswaldense]CDK99127.1 protein of unknown function [Magnetospirillum gryphiswaldense MSR-1 v2]
MIRQPFFRSVNLKDDLSVPERLGHYQPTRKSAPLIRAVFQAGATMAIAAYGSGKSLAAGVGGLLVANSAEAKMALGPVVKRIAEVDRDLYLLAHERLSSEATGQVAMLSGHVRDVPAALAKGSSGITSRLTCGRAQSPWRQAPFSPSRTRMPNSGSS